MERSRSANQGKYDTRSQRFMPHAFSAGMALKVR